MHLFGLEISPDFTTRPFVFKATLAQRFSAAILDVGLLLGFLIALALFARYGLDMPLGDARPRYIPPHPDMGLSRLYRSALIWGGIFTIISAFIACPLRATPGMLAFHLQTRRMHGQAVTFLRIWLWTFTCYAPVFIANALVLYGIAVQQPIISFYTLNVFSLLIVLQCVWFAPILWRADKASLPDLIWGIAVDHYETRESGLHPIRKAFMHLVLLLYVSILLAVGGLFTINLFDAPASGSLRQLQAALADDKAYSETSWNALRSREPLQIQDGIADAACASRKLTYHRGQDCPSRSELRALDEKYTAMLNAYEKEISQASLKTQNYTKYLSHDGLAFTDLLLARWITNFENANQPDVRADSLRKTLQMIAFWRRALETPAPLMQQSAALLHYNHALLVLPVFLSGPKEIVAAFKEDLQKALKPIDLKADDIGHRILAQEYGQYDRTLKMSLIDFFPLIQPTHTRNAFAEASDAVMDLLIDKKPTAQAGQMQKILFTDLASWKTLYNPLGLRFRDLAMSNLRGYLNVFGSYEQNTAVKKMLALVLKARLEGVSEKNIQSFLSQQPSQIKNLSVQWEPEGAYFYFTPFGLNGLRRIVHY